MATPQETANTASRILERLLPEALLQGGLYAPGTTNNDTPRKLSCGQERTVTLTHPQSP